MINTPVDFLLLSPSFWVCSIYSSNSHVMSVWYKKITFYFFHTLPWFELQVLTSPEKNSSCSSLKSSKSLDDLSLSSGLSNIELSDPRSPTIEVERTPIQVKIILIYAFILLFLYVVSTAFTIVKNVNISVVLYCLGTQMEWWTTTWGLHPKAEQTNFHKQRECRKLT